MLSSALPPAMPHLAGDARHQPGSHRLVRWMTAKSLAEQVLDGSANYVYDFHTKSGLIFKQGAHMDVDQLKSAIETCLRQFWDSHSLAVDGVSESVDGLIDPLDSLTAVDALIELEKIVGMELPEGRVIRRGGYDSKGQFIEDLTRRVLKYVVEQSK